MTGGGAPRETGRKRTLGHQEMKITYALKKKKKRVGTRKRERERKKKVTVTDSITNFML